MIMLYDLNHPDAEDLRSKLLSGVLPLDGRERAQTDALSATGSRGALGHLLDHDAPA